MLSETEILNHVKTLGPPPCTKINDYEILVDHSNQFDEVSFICTITIYFKIRIPSFSAIEGLYLEVGYGIPISMSSLRQANSISDVLRPGLTGLWDVYGKIVKYLAIPIESLPLYITEDDRLAKDIIAWRFQTPLQTPRIIEINTNNQHLFGL